MSLRDWLANRWLIAHETSAEEIADLFAVVDRDLGDAAIPRLSPRQLPHQPDRRS